MADTVDTANDQADTILAKQIEHRSALATQRELLPAGVCHYCECTVHSNMLFCDSICRDDYEAESQAKVRNGT